MAAASDHCALRWAVDITRWQPPPSELAFLLSLLPENEQTEATRFKFEADRKRHLVSRLLGRAAAAAALGLQHSAVEIKRTRGGKPYVANVLQKPAGAANYNYSISHEGDYVVLAAEGLCVVGADVAAPQQVRRRANEPLDSFFRSFRDQFSPAEWAAIEAAGPGDEPREAAFRKLWSLKEALIKAMGLGLEFDLRRAEFTLSPGSSGSSSGSATASVAIDGAPQLRWAFHLHELGAGHWASVARCPLEAVVDRWGGFRATWQRPRFSDAEWAAVLAAPEPPFTMMSVADLVPSGRRAEYEAAGGDVL